MKTLYLISLFLVATYTSVAQQKSPEVSLLFGLNQPIVTNGFNFEVNWWTKKFVFDYSHGFGLEFRDNLVTSEARDQRLAFNIKHSLGVGVGYRLTENFNLRIEPKIHVWEMYYDDEFKMEAGKIKTYNTYTLGLGAYYRWMPFAKKDGWVRGLTIAPSARWWPNVGTSLKKDQLTYKNVKTDREEIHKANNIGMSNTPFFVNVSVGYTFSR